MKLYVFLFLLLININAHAWVINEQVEHTAFEVDKKTNVDMFYTCEVKKLLDIWPELKCRGALNLNSPNNLVIWIGGTLRLEKEDMEIDKYYVKPHCPESLVFDPYSFGSRYVENCSANELKVAGNNAIIQAAINFIDSNNRNVLFNRFLQDQYLVFNDSSISFDVKGVVDKLHSNFEEKYSEQIKEEKTQVVLAAIGVFAGLLLLLIIWRILRRIYRSTKSAVSSYLPVIKNQVVNMRADIHESQAKKIMEMAALEEAARITTRAAMTVFDEKEIVALQKQINEALAKGDYEIAQALMTTLRKIEGK